MRNANVRNIHKRMVVMVVTAARTKDGCYKYWFITQRMQILENLKC